MARLICSSAELKRLDQELNTLYAQALAVLPDKAALRSDQRAWLKVRDHSGFFEGEAGRLAEFYRQRLALLRARIDDPALPYRDEYVGVYGRRDASCFIVPDRDEPECKGTTLSTVAIAHISQRSAWVDFDTWFFNGHSCSFQGEGIWKGNTLVAQAQVESGDDSQTQACSVIITFGKQGLSSKPDGDCYALFCGARGSLHEENLKKLGVR